MIRIATPSKYLPPGALAGCGDGEVKHPLMRYHGGKWRLAPWILSFFPAHKRYVESFGGAASVLLRKRRSAVEVYNDLDSRIVNVFRVLQDQPQRRELIERLAITPYARAIFNNAYKKEDDAVKMAANTLVLATMGFGSAGATKGITGFRSDSNRCPSPADLWSKFPMEIAQFARRFDGVLVENRQAIEIIAKHDCAETLHFVDPPYMHNTRQMRGNQYYRHEMSDEDHQSLLRYLHRVEGAVIVSGYDSEMYNDLLSDWSLKKKEAWASARRGSAKRMECLWMNRRCVDLQQQPRLVD